MLSRENYERIARIISNSTLQGEEEYTHNTDTKALVNGLVIYFKEDNPKFDEDKFLIACGL